MIAWMAFIFLMSAMDSGQSSALSGGMTEQIVRIMAPGFDGLPEHEQREILEDAETVVRKLAHAAEYCILGVLSMLFLSTFDKKAGMQIWIALAICIGYAATDELHQTFSDGRSCQAADVMIDAAGAAVGVLVTNWIIMMRKRKQVKGAV